MTDKPKVEWFRSRGVSGSDLGMAFWCHTCGLLVPHSAPEQIDHCNIFSYAPAERDRQALPTRNVGTGFVKNELFNVMESPGWKDDPREELDRLREERVRGAWL